MGFRLTREPTRVSAATRVFFAAQPRVRRLSTTLSLRIQQSPTRQEQIRQRGGDLQSVQVLRQTSVTHLLKAEDPLDYSKHVLDFGAHSGLAAVGRLDPSSTLFAER